MTTYTGRSTIYDYLAKESIPDGDHTLVVNGINIDIEIYNFESDISYSNTPVLGNTIADARMLILNYKGNLTVETGVNLTPQVRKKGMTIFVRGKLTNKGTISMTDRGSNASGQNIYLFRSESGLYEMIPSAGANGRGSWVGGQGIAGDSTGLNGTGRQTGGGGQGLIWNNSTQRLTYGVTGGGTSYSGGGGSGSVLHASTQTNSGQPINSANGVHGGNGWLYETAATTTTRIIALPGAGVVRGSVGNYGNVPYNILDDGIGTGGLLIAYANVIDNKGTIESRGHRGMSVNATFSGNTWSDIGGGGGSGGGSINLFYWNEYINTGTVSASGGGRTANTATGSNLLNQQGWGGGNGTITTYKMNITTTLIEVSGNYKNWRSSQWNTISTTLPSPNTFINEGIDDLSILDRNSKNFVHSMSLNGSLGSGKLFKSNINLEKYLEITNLYTK
ncbi:hypothetical protein [Paenibacillus sp. FSL R7-0272]|uniref:hypothetical protein n=1 Tax=Paenibacillus sp. FSL R7-0272 TaxID=2921679 RepID=UPI0030EF626C